MFHGRVGVRQYDSLFNLDRVGSPETEVINHSIRPAHERIHEHRTLALEPTRQFDVVGNMNDVESGLAATGHPVERCGPALGHRSKVPRLARGPNGEIRDQLADVGVVDSLDHRDHRNALDETQRVQLVVGADRLRRQDQDMGCAEGCGGTPRDLLVETTVEVLVAVNDLR